MKDVDRQLRLLGDADREAQLANLLEALAADVRCVVAAVGRGDLRERHDLVGILGSAALVARHQAPRAFFHRARNELLHPIELGRCGRPRGVAHHDAAHLLGRDMGDEVHRHAAALDALEVAGERRPILSDGAALVRGLFLQPVARCDAGALAEHVERDALPHFALRERIGEHGHVRVGVEIDEAWRDDAACGVDHARGLRVRERSDGGDAPVPDADVARDPRVACAVDDVAAADDDVERRRLLRVRRGGVHRSEGRARERREQHRLLPGHRAPPQAVSVAGDRRARNAVSRGRRSTQNAQSSQTVICSAGSAGSALIVVTSRRAHAELTQDCLEERQHGADAAGANHEIP